MNNVMILTEKILNQGKSRNGFWNNKQLLVLCDGNLSKGWKRRVLNKEVEDWRVLRFLELKDSHLPIGSTARPKPEKEKKPHRSQFKVPAADPAKQLYVAKGKPSADIVAECPFDL